MQGNEAMKLHPQVIEKEGKKEFVVLPYDEYRALEEVMHDYEDLRDLREAKEQARGQEGTPLDKVISEIGLS